MASPAHIFRNYMDVAYFYSVNVTVKVPKHGTAVDVASTLNTTLNGEHEDDALITDVGNILSKVRFQFPNMSHLRVKIKEHIEAETHPPTPLLYVSVALEGKHPHPPLTAVNVAVMVFGMLFDGQHGVETPLDVQHGHTLV